MALLSARDLWKIYGSGDVQVFALREINLDIERGELMIIGGPSGSGKSTLLNALSDGDVLVQDQLFATLDPTTRRVDMPSGRLALFTDTVGFIRNLPHELVAAFHATLEATSQSDLLLHVVDSASPARDDQVAEVDKVLTEIGANEVRQLVVLNKQDLTGLSPAVERDEYGRITRVRLSAKCGSGLPLFGEALTEIALEKLRNPRAPPTDSDTSFNPHITLDSGLSL